MHGLTDILDTTGLLYYTTMLKYERNERKKKIEKKLHRRITPKEKVLFMQQNRTRLAKHFQIKKSSFNPSHSISSYDELFEYLSKIDMGKCFLPEVAIDTFFPCYLIEGNYAWISKSNRGHYRYFSKRKGQVPICLDFLDLVEIYYSIDTYEAIERIVTMFSIPFMEEEWKKKQNEKYQRNHLFIQHELSIYPHLASLIFPHLSILKSLNVLGNVHILQREYQYKEQNVFFASTSYITSFLEEITPSKVNKAINLFAVLGLIEKVPFSHIHPKFLKETERIFEERTLGNRISYYIIHSFQERAFIAEERAKRLMQYGVSYSNISKSTISNIFGENFAETIYVQTVQKNKKKRSKQRAVIEKCLENHFQRILREMGYVTKSMVIGMPVEDLDEKKKKQYLNQMWTLLLAKYDCDYRKPTKAMKEHYRLESNEYVARPNKANISQ